MPLLQMAGRIRTLPGKATGLYQDLSAAYREEHKSAPFRTDT
jgi:hypothetical protein